MSCQYDMTTEDDEFLKEYNSKKAGAEVLSEDGFERIMDVFEETASAQTPFASVDNTVVSYDAMLPSLTSLASPQTIPHAKAIYEYWKTRRIECGNTSIHPSLKFETHPESDDMDPYVCFRRREARQTRKTRARDVQSAEKLKKLRRELEEGRQLIVLSRERELLKRELMNFERSIFEQRQRFKTMKIRLGIKADDEDLIHQKVRCARNIFLLLVSACARANCKQLASEEKGCRASGAAEAAKWAQSGPSPDGDTASRTGARPFGGQARGEGERASAGFGEQGSLPPAVEPRICGSHHGAVVTSRRPTHGRNQVQASQDAVSDDAAGIQCVGFDGHRRGTPISCS